jgi:hypothetical protein
MPYIDKMPAWLRWILLPFASIGAYIIINLIVGIVGSLFDFLSNSPYSSNFSKYVIAPGFAGYGAISVIAILSPAGHLKAVLGGAGFWMFVFGFSTFFALLKPGWGLFLSIGFSVAGVIYGFMEITKKDQ